MHALSCDEIEPLLPAAAAGALDAEDNAAVQEHVFSCARCLPRLADYEGVVEQLAYAVPQVTPSPDLLPRLLQAVQAPAPVAAPVAVPASLPDLAPPVRPAVIVPPAPRWGWLDALLGAYRQLAPVGFAAALVLLVLVGVWGMNLNQQVEQQRALAIMLRMPNSQSVALQPMTTAAPQASAQVYMAPGHAEMAVLVQHLMPQPGRVYQLWLIMKDGSKMPCGTVQVDAQGVAMGMIRLPADPGASVGIIITDESSSQPQVPTGTTWLEAHYTQ